MLPGRGLIARIRGKGDAYDAILASWALGPPQCKEGMRGFMGAARWVAALGQATQRVAASAERARRAAGLAGAVGGGDGGHGGRGSGGCCGAGAPLVGTVVQGHGGAGARRCGGGVRRW